MRVVHLESTDGVSFASTSCGGVGLVRSILRTSFQFRSAKPGASHKTSYAGFPEPEEAPTVITCVLETPVDERRQRRAVRSYDDVEEIKRCATSRVTRALMRGSDGSFTLADRNLGRAANALAVIVM